MTADGETLSATSTSTTIEEDGVTLVGISPTIKQGQNVVVTYTDPSRGNDTKAVQDLVGNDTRSFTTGRNGVPAVSNTSTQSAEPDPLTASFEGVPETHGGNPFTMKLRFSAPITASATTLRGVLSASGGDVTTSMPRGRHGGRAFGSGPPLPFPQ